MNLEEIARKMISMNLGQQEYLLYSLGRTQHIEFKPGEATKLVKENPERFIRIGSRTINRENYNISDEEYAKACISNATYLYKNFPLVFEFYDELMNGIVQQKEIKATELEEIAKKMTKMNLGQQEYLLQSLGRTQHIEFKPEEAIKLAKENPERFIRIGSRTINRENYNISDEEYAKACISNATYLYEKFPLTFEFYDELMNGIVQQKVLAPKRKK